jgi:hypothetical protein
MSDLTGNLSDDEKALREAVADKARAVLSFLPFDFPEANIHSRRRFITDAAKWLAATSIIDPDDARPAPSAGEPDTRSRTMRLVTVSTGASDYNPRGKVWNITFPVKVGFGFVDERPEGRGNSFDALMKVVHTLLQQYVEDSTLGFGDSVEVYRARMVGEPRFVASDAQGRAAHVADLEVFLSVEVC